MDKYYEQLTPSYKSRLHEVYLYLAVVMAIIAAIMITTVFPVGIGAAALAVLFYFLKQNEFIEYEYIFTSGDIDIDKVIEAKKRKKVVNFDIRNVVMMAPLGSSALDGTPKGKKIMAYPKNSKGKVYVAVVSKDNSVSEVYFIPNEEFVSLCFRSNPKNVKKGEY